MWRHRSSGQRKGNRGERVAAYLAVGPRAQHEAGVCGLDQSPMFNVITMHCFDKARHKHVVDRTTEHLARHLELADVYAHPFKVPMPRPPGPQRRCW